MLQLVLQIVGETLSRVFRGFHDITTGSHGGGQEVANLARIVHDEDSSFS